MWAGASCRHVSRHADQSVKGGWLFVGVSVMASVGGELAAAISAKQGHCSPTRAQLPMRLGVDPPGRAAAAARGTVMGASPRAWCSPPTEVPTAEAIELQTQLAASRLDPLGPSTSSIDEIALLHAVTPEFAHARHQPKSSLEPSAVEAWRQVDAWNDGPTSVYDAVSPSTSPPSHMSATIADVFPQPREPRRSPPPSRPTPPRKDPKPTAASQSTLDVAAAAAAAAERALAAAPGACKAAVFVTRESLAAALLSESIVSHAQVACGAEARIKLGGKPPKRIHIAAHAIDEMALDRAVICVLRLMSLTSELLALEVRWLLRSPSQPPDAILQKWLEATAAAQAALPIEQLGAELPADAIKLTLTCDGWEDWQHTPAARAAGAAVPLIVAWLVSFVRYGGRVPVLRFIPLRPELESLVNDHPATLRTLCAHSHGALGFVLRGGPWLLLVGPRTAQRRARSLLQHWEEEGAVGPDDRLA